MPLLKIENFSFQYALANRPALQDIRLTVEEGEFLLLFGPSGCGKTTLLRHLKPELWPAGNHSGSIDYNGQPIGQMTPEHSACEIGLVMQNPEAQIVTDTVWHELAFGLENLGLENGVIRRRVAEMASFFGIGSWLHRKTAELSGGQKQMLNLASILAMQPRLLLLDEPTAMLDPVSSREFVEMAARLNREFGITVVMAGHRLEEVFHLAARAAVLENGRLLHCGPPSGFGPFLSANPQYLCYMPAAAQIYAACEPEAGDRCPVTVNEARSYLLSRRRNFPAPAAQAAEPPQKREKPLLKAQRIGFRYHKDTPDVLRELDIQAFKGELACILGENGSGKSTLFGVLSGLLRPQRGDIFLDEKRLSAYKGELYRGNVGLLPQNPRALFTGDTLREDLLSAAQSTGEDAATAVDAVVKDFALGALLQSHPYDLSGGEMRRAAIAKLTLRNPRLFLLDEPTAGLDAASQEALAAVLHRLCGQGTCVLVITHDIEFAAKHADRCMLLFDGAIACEGAPRRFFGGNYFYTTAANRIARGISADAVTCEDVIGLCKDV